MRRISGIVWAVFLAFMPVHLGCGGGGSEVAGGNNGNVGGNVVRVAADISSPSDWTDEYVYVIGGATVVRSTLVIHPGTTVKFEDGGQLATDAGGTIVADGTAARRIAFTSIKDDARGADTNGDGDSTSPSRGDWWGISLRGGNGSVFRNCDFTYSGGSLDGGGGSALDLGTTDGAIVDNCLFAGNDGGDMEITRGALQASTAGHATVITGNVFHGNNVPLQIHPAIPIGGTNTFHDPADPSRTNTYNGIFVPGGELTVPTEWSGTEVPYVVSAPLRVHQALTLFPGTIVKFAIGARMATGPGGRIDAAGTATSGIFFTSVRDDVRGGDTNGDGDATAPSRGDWGGILLFDGTGSVFRNCEFRHGGIDGGSSLFVQGTSGTIVDGCVFAGNDGGLDASRAGRGTIVANNTFYGNNIPLAINSFFDVDDTNTFHDPACPSRGNTYDGIFYRGEDITEARRWSATEVPFVIPSTLRVLATLMVGPDVVLKFGPHQGLRVYNRQGEGALAASPEARFTSIRDDALLGDTNGDGAATSPQAGDWDGIWFEYLEGIFGAYPAWPSIYYDSY